MPLPVLGVLPSCLHPPPPQAFYVAAESVSGAEALLDLSGWLMKGLRQVSGAPKRDCAALGTRRSRTASRAPPRRTSLQSGRWPRTPRPCAGNFPHAPLVFRGGVTGALLEALGAEALDLVEGLSSSGPCRCESRGRLPADRRLLYSEAGSQHSLPTQAPRRTGVGSARPLPSSPAPCGTRRQRRSSSTAPPACCPCRRCSGPRLLAPGWPERRLFRGARDRSGSRALTRER